MWVRRSDHPQDEQGVGAQGRSGASQQTPKGVRPVVGQPHLLSHLAIGDFDPVAQHRHWAARRCTQATARRPAGSKHHPGTTCHLSCGEDPTDEAAVQQQAIGGTGAVQQILGDFAFIDRGERDLPGPYQVEAQIGAQAQAEPVEPLAVGCVVA
jgi:hypothetical protein